MTGVSSDFSLLQLANFIAKIGVAMLVSTLYQSLRNSLFIFLHKIILDKNVEIFSFGRTVRRHNMDYIYLAII